MDMEQDGDPNNGLKHIIGMLWSTQLSHTCVIKIPTVVSLCQITLVNMPFKFIQAQTCQDAIFHFSLDIQVGIKSA